MGPKRPVAKKATQAAGPLLISSEDARELVSRPWEQLEVEDRLRLLNCSHNAKPVSSSRNPDAFDNLVPSEGGYRVKGLFQRDVDQVITSSLPEAEEFRSILETPAGLKNLGNTCYVNSALQVLFTNERFRTAILSLSDEVLEADQKGILRELRKLFIDLQFSQAAGINPIGFLESLKLQDSEQQDAQEFQKLLMQELETSMARSCDPLVRRSAHVWLCVP